MEYESLERIYATAIQALAARRGTVDSQEYAFLRKAADEARLEAELARLGLEKHKRVHTKAN
jgi:hypothetical protein